MATSVDTMTEDQLREHLYRDLQGRGILETMKSQLRQKLARELHKGAKRSPKFIRKRPELKKPTLSDQISSGMVADYLKKAGFEYSLSVFLPEAGVNIDKLYSMEDLVQYLRVPPSSLLYNKLLPAQQDQSLLEQLLGALVDCSGTQSVSLQQGPGSNSANPATNLNNAPRDSVKLSIAEQLCALDQSYAQKAEKQKVKTQQNLEERLLTFQRDLEAQHKLQLETELSLYKSRELAKVRMEEREKCQRELTDERLQITLAHQKKIEELRKMEQQMLERYRKKEQDLEAGIHAQRQTLLAELSSLKLRESDLLGRTELKKRAASLEEERLVKLEQQLAGREKAIERTTSYYESMAEEKIHRFKLESESQLQLKQNELSQWEAKVKCNRDKTSSLQSEITKLSAELQSERNKADRLQSLLHDAMARQISLQGQKDALQQKVDQVGDYEQLEKKSQKLTQELENAEKKLLDYKHRNSDNQRLIRDLQSKVPRPTRELEAVRTELDEIRAAHHREVFVMESGHRELKRQLVAQTEYSNELQKKLDDQMMQLLFAQREVKDIHSLLKLGGAKTGIKRNGTLSQRNVSLKKKVPAVTTSVHYPSPSVRNEVIPSSLNHEPSSQPADVSSQLLAESRATIARLEKEAQELEVTCHSVHQNSYRSPLVKPTMASANTPTTIPLNTNDWMLSQVVLPTMNSSTAQPQPHYTIHSPAPPASGPALTSTVWAPYPTMTVHTPMPNINLPQNVTTDFPTTIATSVTKPQPVLNFQPPSSSTSSVSPTKITASSNPTLTEPVNVDNSPQFTPIDPCTSINSPPSTLPQLAAMASTLPSVITKPPRVSLDELWKSSQEKSQTTPTTTCSTTVCMSSKQVESVKLQEDTMRLKNEHRSTTPITSLAMQDPKQAVQYLPEETELNVDTPPPLHTQPDNTAVPDSPNEDSGVDPVMLKYMELVKQNRENEKIQANVESPADTESGKLDYGIPSLTQGSESFGGFSDKEDNPFEDW